MLAVPAKIVRLLWIPCLSLLLAWSVTLTPAYDRLEGWALDTQQFIAAENHFFRDALIVEIDEVSVRELQPYFGAWPYKRDAFALVLDFLGEMGAKAVVFDILFSEEREGDAEFRQAIARNGNAVLAASTLNGDPGGETSHRLRALGIKTQTPLPAPHWRSAALPLPALAGPSPRAAHVGIISVIADEDGVLRNIPLIHEIDGSYLPSMPLAALFPTGGFPEIQYLPEKGMLRAGDLAWRVEANGSVKPRFPRNTNSVLTMPLHRLAKAALGIPSGDLNADLFKGKTVFIGNTSLFSDRVKTPRGIMNGIHVMAIAHQALAHGFILKPQQWHWSGVLLLVALLPSLTAPFRPRRSALVSSAIVVATLCAIYALNLGLFYLLDQPSPLIFPLMAALVSGLLGMVIAMREEISGRAQTAISRAAAETELALEQQKFVAMVSHEFRTPLSIIDASLQSLKRLAQGISPDVQARHQKIHRASHRLQALIRNNLAEDRLRDARLPYAMEPVDLFELLATIAGQAEWSDLTVNIDAPRATVIGNSELLGIALTNLIDNAIKYSPEGGNILIEGGVHDNRAEICITDTGIGIAPESLPHIFDRYYRAERNGKIGGSGLGLYLVRQIIELHNGTISASSAPGRGTAMRIQLPVATGPGPEGEPMGSS